MAKPTNREEFAEYCLRKLGKPVIQINVSDEQVDDRIDEALSYYQDYHFDATEKIYYKHQITQDDIDNGYILMPENIIGAVSIFPWSSSNFSSMDMFDIRYQIALNDLYTLTSTSMVPYHMTMTHLSLIQEILIGKQPIRYNRHRNRLYIDMNWKQVRVGQFFIVEAYEVVDPDQFVDVWKDRWLQNYATAKIKYQWGSNLTKMTEMVLPGGVKFNGTQILKDADAEIKKMEHQMVNDFSLPACDMIG